MADAGIRFPAQLLRQTISECQYSRSAEALLSGAGLVQHLESMIWKHNDAINSRDFSPQSYVWQHKASWWRAEIGLMADKWLNLEQYIQSWLQIEKEYPSVFMRPMDMVTEVHEEAGWAETLINAETHGMPPGLIRPYVGIVSFKLVDGQWLFTKFKTICGFGNESGSEPVAIS